MPRARTYKGRRQAVRKSEALRPAEKDLLNEEPEGGIHGHVLDRGLGMTNISGAHSHVFLLPAGEILTTSVDGMHQHSMDEYDPNTVWEGVHAHTVGDQMTEVDGWHRHSLQTGTTLFDGLHVHQLVLGEMTVQSLMPHEIFALQAFVLAAELELVDREYEVAAHVDKDSGTLALRWNDAVLVFDFDHAETHKGDFSFDHATTKGIEHADAEADYGDEIAKGTLEVGLLTTDQAELFLQLPSPLAGNLTITRSGDGASSSWVVRHSTNGVPGILRPGAPAPTVKRSCLPASLRNDLPEGAHFWKATTPESAAMLRDWVIESEYFTKDAEVRLVQGKLRKVHVETKYFGHTPDPADDDFDAPAAVMRALGEGTVAKYYTVPSTQTADAVRKFTEAGTLLAVEDTPDSRAALAEHGRLFKLRDPDASHLVFAANTDVGKADVVWVHAARKPKKTRRPSYASKAMDKLGNEAAERVYKTLKHTRVIRDDDSEERFVYGIAMEPDATDSHGDFQTSATIKVAAHGFMEDYGNVGLQHRKFINGKVKILESAIAMSDFTLGGEKVVKGTWIFAVRVLDDDLWEAVKSGDIGGFSIGGVAIRDPLDEAA
jgi:hypothetical protein